MASLSSALLAVPVSAEIELVEGGMGRNTYIIKLPAAAKEVTLSRPGLPLPTPA